MVPWESLLTARMMASMVHISLMGQAYNRETHTEDLGFDEVFVPTDHHILSK